jgi:hypothetical protein
MKDDIPKRNDANEIQEDLIFPIVIDKGEYQNR